MELVSPSLYVLALLTVAPFLLAGLIVRIKALAAGRKGPPLAQPFWDFVRLLRKGEVRSTSGSFVYALAPAVSLAALLACLAFLPLAQGRALVSCEGDAALVCWLLALSRFFLVLAALDSGSSFEGMGASREAMLSSFGEAGFFAILGALALLTGHSSLSGIVLGLDRSSPWELLVLGLLALSLFLLLLVECARVPVDDPATHLELTMIHEVLLLDHSGVSLGLLTYAAQLKLALFTALIAVLVLPPSLSPWGYAFAFAGVLLASAFVVGILESTLARLRMIHLPQLSFVVSAMALLAALLAWLKTRGVA